MQNETFGDKIKKIRLSHGDSVRKVAMYADISPSYYSQVENNKRNIPKPINLRKIAAGLRISEQEIFNLAGLIPDYKSNADERKAQKPQKIQVTGSKQQLIIPGDQNIQTALAPYFGTKKIGTVTNWLRVTESDLTSLGILSNDVVVIQATAEDKTLPLRKATLIAINLDEDHTVIRQAYMLDYSHLMLTLGGMGQPLFISWAQYLDQFVGKVINIYRDLH
ncbi:helix-turn-helix domain-containing protein [Lactiplantibacillus daowaiensis]|uniref:Helix-turn-helix domain-containing protein n=1 Tax=Lactiplantibacillus daowaiensis TaxID=2559918 RepID=A0ABW1S251_9LACO|nr:helix-turn-helix transcriptional regulator [Lactiplantibacillus daowaiensis]